MTSAVVYTALFGPTEDLLEQEVARSSSTRFVCFTDNPRLRSESWEIRLVEPLFPADSRRSQRDIKIRGHEALASYDHWLYIDNTVRLKVSPEEIIARWLPGFDWAALNHDARETIWDEFEANRNLAKDTEERLNEQLHDYSLYHRNVLDQRPLWNGFFARRNTASVRDFTDLWFDHVLRYSARDQLSILIALNARPVSLNRIDAGVRNSPWHDWPHRQNETAESKAYRHARTFGLKPLAEELRVLTEERTKLQRTLDELESEVQALRDRQFLGLTGIWRGIANARRKRRRIKRQRDKRR
jgi:hypothetical protein